MTPLTSLITKAWTGAPPVGKSPVFPRSPTLHPASFACLNHWLADYEELSAASSAASNQSVTSRRPHTVSAAFRTPRLQSESPKGGAKLHTVKNAFRPPLEEEEEEDNFGDFSGADHNGSGLEESTSRYSAQIASSRLLSKRNHSRNIVHIQNAICKKRFVCLPPSSHHKIHPICFHNS